MSPVVLVTLGLLLVASPALSYPEGAPTDACATLTPTHDEHVRETTVAPYTITTDSDVYTAGSPVTVTIEPKTDDTSFKGFLVVARKVGSSTNEGNFTSLDTFSQTIQCSRAADAITHTNKDDKAVVQFQWTSSESFRGTVIFTGTIVQKYDKYWTGVKSSSIVIS